MKENKNILVTGGAGFLVQTLLSMLLKILKTITLLI